MTNPNKRSPSDIDEIDIGELLDVIDALRDCARVGTFDEAPGEREIYERATELLRRYSAAT